MAQFPGKKNTKCSPIHWTVAKTAKFVESYQIHFEKDLSKGLPIIQTLEQKSSLRLHFNCFSDFVFLHFFYLFFPENFNIFVGPCRGYRHCVAITSYFSSMFPLVSVKLQWLVIVLHIWFAMEISIFITHLQIDHYVGGVN